MTGGLRPRQSTAAAPRLKARARGGSPVLALEEGFQSLFECELAEVLELAGIEENAAAGLADVDFDVGLAGVGDGDKVGLVAGALHG